MEDLACLYPHVAAAGPVAQTPGPCPTHIADERAKGDRLAHTDTALYAALGCPKQLLRFRGPGGAAGRREMSNRLLLDQRALDWLNEPLQ